ncbi:MAG TPA: hypothetical protein PLO33_19395, partial [Kouleothrix sp.]|nr:hypothetical protein [Kouleothrix sp.]
ARSGGGLGRYIIWRALLIVPTVFILVTMVFVLMRAIGDPITASVGDRLPPEQLAERILALADDWGLGVVPAHVIDTHGILAATRLAMQVALLRLARPADALLIDAVRLEFWGCPQRALIKGDARCLSIAAASIVAKVARDRMMCALDRQLPRYGFAMHKGYGTALHERALRALGPSPQHRRSFQPIAEFVATGAWPARRRAAEPGPEAAVYA